MKDLTVILPIYNYGDNNTNMLCDRAIKSLIETDSEKDTKLIIVGKENEVNSFAQTIETVFGDRYTTVVVEDDNFCVRINAAVNNCTTKYFSILEMDDEYTPNYFKNVSIYTNSYPNYSCIVPLNEVIDFETQENGVVGYANEAFWASSFSEKIGHIDEESLKDYLSTNVTGAIFNTEDFISVGALKPSIKIAFWHEFLLRLMHKDKIVYVMPKVGYKHYFNRSGSLSDIYNKTITPEEADWWINLAQEEYYYKNDRKKKYEE